MNTVPLPDCRCSARMAPPRRRTVSLTMLRAQTRTAYGPGPVFIHPVEPLEYMLHVLVGDADAVVLHADLHGGVRDMQGGVNKAHGAGIFDAVFYEVIEDLVDVVLRGPDHGVLVGLVGQRDLLFPGHYPQHTDYPLQHPGHRYGIGGVLNAAVQPGQAQQILGDAAEPLGPPGRCPPRIPGWYRHSYPPSGEWSPSAAGYRPEAFSARGWRRIQSGAGPLPWFAGGP